MNKNEPLFIYFIPMINEDNREVIFSTTINEFEINNNNSDTVVIIMPENFYIKNEDQGEVNEDSNHIVKMMFYNLIENFKSLLLFDKIIIFHNNMLDEYGKLLSEIKNKTQAESSIIIDIIKISRKFYRRLEDFNYVDKKMFDAIRKYHKKTGLVDFDETDDLQKIIFDQIVKNRKILLERKNKLKKNISNVTVGIMGKTFEIQANENWNKMKEKGKILYYPPGILPVD
ncbi:MAG: hypothetical protein ACTSQO_05070 [Candidatus Helarchaeota archaeon]